MPPNSSSATCRPRAHPYVRARQRQRCEMGQIHGKKGFRNPYKHHLDPISLNAQTLPNRKHLFGDTDVDIVVKGHRFPAHRELLIQESNFFRIMFFGTFSERDKREVELKEIFDPVLVGQLIHFMYFRSVYLTPGNAQDLLGLATYFQMERLQRQCIKYIQNKIDKHNCVALFLYTRRMGPFELQKHAEDFLLAHLEHVVDKCQDFVQLSVDHICDIISSENLNVQSEFVVLRAVVRWVCHDLEGRQRHLQRLLQHVHFRLMSNQELEHVRRDSRLKKLTSKIESSSSTFLLSELDEARRYLGMELHQKVDYWKSRAKPCRWPKIFIVMRMYWKNLPIEYFDFRTRQWRQLAEVCHWRSCAAFVASRSTVYLIGGEEMDKYSPTGSRTVNRVSKYDCEQQFWLPATSMNLARRWAAAIVAGDYLYAIGGIGGRGGTFEHRLDSVERLDLRPYHDERERNKNQWQLVSPMSTPRSSHSVETLDGKIFVVGGGDGKDWLCSSEVYDPATDSWSPISSLLTKRWKCGLCALNGHLYAIGGMDSPNAGYWGAPLRTVERYFPATDEWTEVASMNVARFGAACVAYKGKLYVCGGFGVGKSILSSAECYDPDTDKWTKLNGMRKMCGFVGGVLVDRPIHFDRKPSGDQES